MKGLPCGALMGRVSLPSAKSDALRCMCGSYTSSGVRPAAVPVVLPCKSHLVSVDGQVAPPAGKQTCMVQAWPLNLMLDQTQCKHRVCSGHAPVLHPHLVPVCTTTMARLALPIPVRLQRRAQEQVLGPHLPTLAAGSGAVQARADRPQDRQGAAPGGRRGASGRSHSQGLHRQGEAVQPLDPCGAHRCAADCTAG